MKCLLGIFLFVSGCAYAPKWVDKQYEPKKSGIIAIRDEGIWLKSHVKYNREEADKEIIEFCQGKYKLISEGFQSSYAGNYSSGNANATVTGYGKTAYASGYSSGYSIPIYVGWINMVFECENQRAAASN